MLRSAVLQFYAKHLSGFHRPSKFPEIESELAKWLYECRDKKVQLTDSVIRNKAKEVAKQLQIPEDKFKASSGWVENFKHRHHDRETCLSIRGQVQVQILVAVLRGAAVALIAVCRPRCAWGPPLVPRHHLAFGLPARTVPRLLRSLRSPLRPLINHRQTSPVGITVASRTT